MLFLHPELSELCIMACQMRVELPFQKSKFSTICYSTLFFICHILANDDEEEEELSERCKEGRHRKRKRGT